MKFYPVTTPAPEGLAEEYQAARAIGVLRLGRKRLFFRAKRKIYYLPYGDVRRFYRRVLLVPARMCCGRGDLAVEYLVLEGDSGQLAQIQLPGERAALGAMDALREKLPGVPDVKPEPKEEP